MTRKAHPMADDVRTEVYGLDVTDEDIADWNTRPETATEGSPTGHHLPSKGGDHPGLSPAEEVASSFTMIASPDLARERPAHRLTRPAGSRVDFRRFGAPVKSRNSSVDPVYAPPVHA